GRGGVADLGRLEPFPEPLNRELGHSLFEEAVTEHAAAFDGAARILAGELELADRFVDEAHLFVRDPEVVVRLVVLGRKLLLDALLELPEEVFQGSLPLRRGDLRGLFGDALLGELLFELFGEVEELLLVGEEVPSSTTGTSGGDGDSLSPARLI